MSTLVNFTFLDDFPELEKWVKNIRSKKLLKKGLTDEKAFNTMISEFCKNGKWGLKYPLAKM
jgi:hypothetical protein